MLRMWSSSQGPLLSPRSGSRGGNAKELKELPQKFRAGDNRNAFVGGFRLWGKID
jgi:hypothetical protein